MTGPPLPARTAAGASSGADRRLGLYQLLDPVVHADPYPLYHRLRSEDPVHWDPFLHAWVVTRYDDVMRVLLNYSADRTPSPEQLDSLGLKALGPIAQIMVRQMLYLDPPEHTRVRMLAAKGFTPRRVEVLRAHVADIVDELLDAVQHRHAMDVVADFAVPLPAIVSCEMLGLPTADWPQLTGWTSAFALLLGNFQYDPARAETVRETVDDMTAYFRQAIHAQADDPQRRAVARARHRRGRRRPFHRGGGHRQRDPHAGRRAGDDDEPDRERTARGPPQPRSMGAAAP